MKNIAFIDTEISINSKSIQDIGAVKSNGSIFHSGNPIRRKLLYHTFVFLISSIYQFQNIEL